MLVQEEIIIDGTKFNNLLEFVEYMNDAAFDKFNWQGNLDAFNDLLRGGFGNKIEGKSIRWINSIVSKEKLGYGETISWLTEQIKHCHPSNIEHVENRLADAKRDIGKTIYDVVVEIISIHGPGGEESGDIDRITFE